MDCNICVTKFNKSSNKEVKCLYCGYSSCLSCVKKMMIDMGENCPDCKKAWSKDFIRSNTPKVWYDGEYKTKRKEQMFEREKTLLQTAIPVLKAEQYSSKMKKEIDEITNQLRELQNKKTNLELELRHNTERLRQGLDEEEVKEENGKKREISFIRACPVNECRGFLSTSWKCEVCETWVCKDCHEIKNGKNDEDHKCNEDSIKSASLLMKDTKPCPKCSARIHKIEGCPAMFCTNCKTCFNWNTGKISTKNSNPHFYEWNIRNGSQEQTRVERGCYNWRDIILKIIRKVKELFKGVIIPMQYYDYKIQNLSRMADHIEDSILRIFMTNQVEDSKLLRLRVSYLKKEITPEVWKKNIFMIEKKFEYDTTMHNLYEVVMNVIRGSLVKMSDSSSIEELENAFKEIGYVINYFNSNVEKLAKDFGYSVYDYISYDIMGSDGNLMDMHNRILTYYRNRSYSTHFRFEVRKFNNKREVTPDKKV
jgi:hypothetical protein